VNVLLPVVGAIIVALIAAVTAQSRLRQQLWHDRELKDLDELRALLDECAQVIGGSSTALQRYGWFARLQEQRVEGPPSKHLPRNAAEAIDTYSAESQHLGELYQRVVLRLGGHHHVTMELLEVQASLTAATFVMDPNVNPSDEATEQWASALSNLRDTYFAFLEGARVLVGSRIR
jgi:hypothetical protein